MHSRKRKLLGKAITWWVVVGPVYLYAQAQPPQLNLADARAMAIRNHPRVLASQATVQRAGQMIVEAKSAYYPTLNGDITGAGSVLNARIGAGLINDPRLFNHFGAGVTLSQLITDSGRTP